MKIMAKKRKQASRPIKKENDRLTLSDALGDDILEKLKATKKELSAIEKVKEEDRQKQVHREREERENNKSFEDLLKDY